MSHLPTWPVAAGGLVVGFAVAKVTGSRPLGAVPLLAAGIWCALAWRASAGPRRGAALLGIYLGAFALSHVLALFIGAWPAVFVAAAVVAAASFLWGEGDGASARRPRPA